MAAPLPITRDRPVETNSAVCCSSRSAVIVGRASCVATCVAVAVTSFPALVGARRVYSRTSTFAFAAS